MKQKWCGIKPHVVLQRIFLGSILDQKSLLKVQKPRKLTTLPLGSWYSRWSHDGYDLVPAET